MPARSKVASLPRAVRERLDARLVEGGFSGYKALEAWLESEGFAISHAALHRYGQGLERKLDAIRLATGQAKALVAGSDDAEGALSLATLRMAQHRLFELFHASEGQNLKEVSAAARAIADMARASISVAAERRKAADAERSAAAERAGLSGDVVAAIRAAVEGEA